MSELSWGCLHSFPAYCICFKIKFKDINAGKYSDSKIKQELSLEHFFGITLRGIKRQIEAAGEVCTPDRTTGLDTAGLHRLCSAEHRQAIRLVRDGRVGARLLVEGCELLYLYNRTLRKPILIFH